MFKIFKKKSVRLAVPFIIFIIAAPFGLTEFQRLRFEYKPLMADDFREQVKQKGLKMKKPEESSLEAIYEKTMKDKDTRNWEIKRIPRPWEEEDTNK